MAQALRRCATSGDIGADDTVLAIATLRDLSLERHGHDDLLDRVWALRRNLTACDAVYVALADALGAVLITCDRKPARGPGLAARVEFVSA